MNKNEELRTFLLSNAKRLTEEWYDSIDKNEAVGVYASTDSKAIQALKEQNHEFHLYICNVFVEDEKTFFDAFEVWINKIAKDNEHTRTPISSIIKEFMRVREQYRDLINEFVYTYEGHIESTLINAWEQHIIRIFDITILKFVTASEETASTQLKAHQEMIHELSSPVIVIKKDVALLPLVGDIDTARAKMILESTLQQCADKHIAHLYIDLSGVVMVDTMVAHQIFQLIDTLNLLGVKSTLSGIRPEVAQTAIQLGLSFENIRIKSNLAQALETDINITVQ
ncbi:RsbT co-antagonist protein RsbRB [Priestia aryabhattai]|uniref:STAS domain-containing protein n=1 Tax=Priestia aryabhattai TaxID=412384 RepID=UPI000B5138BF|nr:STAS domain-containing protein [Priestia aryabhattai]OVE34153.1 RsbT co-antagonist protein RsbRB [Priestia aryabhattai]